MNRKSIWICVVTLCLGWGMMTGACGVPEPGTEAGQETTKQESATEKTGNSEPTIEQGSQEPALEPSSPEPKVEPVEEPTVDASEPVAPETKGEPAVETKPEATNESAPDVSNPPENPADSGAKTCTDIKKDYGALVARNLTCSESADCHVVNGYCAVGLGGCWHVVSTQLKQSDLKGLRDQWTQQSCTGPVCSCTPPPKTVSCVSGTCKAGAATTCDNIRNSYDQTVQSNQGCKQDSDCHILNGHCGVGIGGCYYTVNKSLTQSQLDQIAKQFQSQPCSGPVCRCARPPAAAKCDNSICQPK